MCAYIYIHTLLHRCIKAVQCSAIYCTYFGVSQSAGLLPSHPNLDTREFRAFPKGKIHKTNHP